MQLDGDRRLPVRDAHRYTWPVVRKKLRRVQRSAERDAAVALVPQIAARLVEAPWMENEWVSDGVEDEAELSQRATLFRRTVRGRDEDCGTWILRRTENCC